MVILTRQTEDDGTVEYPIDPAAIIKALAIVVPAKSGFIAPGANIISVESNGTSTKIIAYRPPQITGIWLEGSQTALRVPMPPLIMKMSLPGRSATVCALAHPPKGENDLIYGTPLANVGSSGWVCWGSVSVPQVENNDLGPVWDTFFGTRFANHSVGQKSKKHPDDIRAMLIELHDRQAEEYPVHDLVATMQGSKQMTIKDMIEEG